MEEEGAMFILRKKLGRGKCNSGDHLPKGRRMGRTCWQCPSHASTVVDYLMQASGTLERVKGFTVLFAWRGVGWYLGRRNSIAVYDVFDAIARFECTNNSLLRF